MSLLLDALKKAAEKKARQAEEANVETDVSSESSGIEGSDGYSEDSTLLFADRTELDDDQTDLSQHDDAGFYEDKSEFDEDDTQISDEATIIQSAADSTDRTDVTEFADQTEVTEFVDKTEVTEFIDQTEVTEFIDKTEVTEFIDKTEVTEFTDQTEATRFVDDPGHNVGDRGEDEADTDYRTELIDSRDDTLQSSFDENETQTQLSNRDVLDFLGDAESFNNSSDITIEAAAAGVDADAGEIPEDLSLYLVDRTTTSIADDTTTSVGGSHNRQQSGDFDSDSFQAVDSEQGRDDQTSTITSDKNPTVTAAAGIELDSLRHEHTIIRPDVTSTHTYAPDNYDRTLIRPPDDDASRIFAGMKSEEDVLMTPDYAKRVFLSKSSAIRVQHNKIYLGIVVSILLATGIFSLFQLQDEYDRIDSTLLPLKRDPKPGVLKTVDREDKSNLFANTIEPDIDTKMLKIVESAASGVPADEAAEQDPAEVETESGTEAAQATVDEPIESEITIAGVQPVDSTVEQATKNTSNIVVKKTDTKRKPDEQVSGNLQITSISRVTQKDEWLAEAYSAYQNGDDKSALAKYLKVLEIDPENRNALLARAAIAVGNGDTASAIKDYQQLLTINPKDSLAMSSLISVANTEPELSETQLKLMIRDEPDSPYLNFVLANIYAAQNRWQEAQGHYFKALENNPGDPNYAYNLAVSLEHIAKPNVAITYYKMAISNINNGLATFSKAVVDHRIEMLQQL